MERPGAHAKMSRRECCATGTQVVEGMSVLRPKPQSNCASKAGLMLLASSSR